MFNLPADNSFVDRDMIMRYHWGLAVGHLYTHGHATVTRTSNAANNNDLELELDDATDINPGSYFPHHDGDSDTEDPELGFEDRQNDLIDAGDGLEDDWEVEEDYDDYSLAIMDEMYDLNQPQGYHD
jgi:hypothetical protein